MLVAKVTDNADLIHESGCGVITTSALENAQHPPKAATETNMSII